MCDIGEALTGDEVLTYNNNNDESNEHIEESPFKNHLIFNNMPLDFNK